MTFKDNPLSYFLILRTSKPKKEIVKQAMDYIKSVLLQEIDEYNRECLSKVGIELSMIYVKL
jgi:hypothetical protein